MKKLLPIFLVAVLAVSCRQPDTVEQFIRGEGPYTFSVDMTDSTATYAFDVFTRVDATQCPAEICLEMAWKAPCDSVFTETVYLPMTGPSSYFFHDAYAPYRDRVVPAEWGLWELVITVPEQPEGFRGMGLVTKKQWVTEN